MDQKNRSKISFKLEEVPRDGFCFLLQAGQEEVQLSKTATTCLPVDQSTNNSAY